MGGWRRHAIQTVTIDAGATEKGAEDPAASTVSDRVLPPRNPPAYWAVWVGIIVAFAPVIVEYAHEWATDERYSHGWLILPISAGLVWVRRDRLNGVPWKGTALGALLVIVGVAAHMASWFLRFPHVGMWAFVTVLAGTTLALYGRDVWRTVRFPVFFLLFAGTWPNRLIEPVNLKIQSLSAVGAAHVMSFLGYTVLREGNRIEIPGYVVEVADTCSGYKKTVALLAFAFLYGFVMHASAVKRVILCLLAIPVAVLANVLRVAGLIAVTSAWGSAGLHRAHDTAEMVALGLAFVVFVWLGKVLGCRLPERL